MINKPKMHSRDFYDYFECKKYLEEKYSFKERDLGAKQDFWHWLAGRHITGNDSFFTLSREELEEIEEGWVKVIYQCFIEEFADSDGIAEFFVSW